MAGDGRVTVAYVHPNELAASFHACLIGMLMFDAAHKQHLLHDHGQIAVRCGTDGLVAARDQAVAAFLATDVEWLLWIDSDMGFAPDSLEHLLAQADADKVPVLGGLCFAARETETDGMGGFRSIPKPTIYHYREHEGLMRFMGTPYYPVNRMVRCDATGSAMILIHRDALRRVWKEYGTCYKRLPGTDGGMLGEDISFCVRLGVQGVPVHVFTGVRTTHLKPWWVAEQDFWDRYPAPPAVERTAVVVPVMRRPENAGPFMRSLRASTGLATVYAVGDPANDSQTTAAWGIAGAIVIDDGGNTTFAQRANIGYRQTTEPWLLFVGDDVRFHPGWLDHAQHVADVEQASVVATNDLGNRAVMAGRHATHPLIRRSYIDEQGASWDGPGVVAHEGYRHWFVDDEWTMVAQQRGVFAAALGSVVEHLHPLWGKAADDEVYRKGQRQADRDRRIFERRLREHAA